MLSWKPVLSFLERRKEREKTKKVDIPIEVKKVFLHACQGVLEGLAKRLFN